MDSHHQDHHHPGPDHRQRRVFAMAEIAVVSARKARLQQRAEEGDRRAQDRPRAGQFPQPVSLHDPDRHHAGRHPGRRLRRGDHRRTACPEAEPHRLDRPPRRRP
ncbi:MAG: hypothetical protein MZU95_02620 [Desulfomicrobium escambiense]|nr:hypothetical protein [Desulfomicrobium escambiense]